MQPAIYGYMRVVSDGEVGDEAERINRELADYANREGFTLDQAFTETSPIPNRAFTPCSTPLSVVRLKTSSFPLPQRLYVSDQAREMSVPLPRRRGRAATRAASELLRRVVDGLRNLDDESPGGEDMGY